MTFSDYKCDPHCGAENSKKFEKNLKNSQKSIDNTSLK